VSPLRAEILCNGARANCAGMQGALRAGDLPWRSRPRGHQA
jgi:hypothetical protein